MHKLFVYGTLMSGYGNHRLLENSSYVGEYLVNGALFVAGLPFFSADYLDDTPSLGVIGELYEVDDETLKRCDGLEGHPVFYRRITTTAIPMDGAGDEETCFIYEYPNAKRHGAFIVSGDYRTERPPYDLDAHKRRYEPDAT